jgi:hypothetical protein
MRILEKGTGDVCWETKTNRVFKDSIVANPLTVSFIEKARFARGALRLK